MVEGPSAALQLLSDLAAPVESPSPAPPSAGLGGAAPSRRRSAVGGRSCSVRRAHTRTSAREPAGTQRVRDAEEGDASEVDGDDEDRGSQRPPRSLRRGLSIMAVCRHLLDQTVFGSHQSRIQPLQTQIRTVLTQRIDVLIPEDADQGHNPQDLQISGAQPESPSGVWSPHALGSFSSDCSVWQPAEKSWLF